MNCKLKIIHFVSVYLKQVYEHIQLTRVGDQKPEAKYIDTVYHKSKYINTVYHKSKYIDIVNHKFNVPIMALSTYLISQPMPT